MTRPATSKRSCAGQCGTGTVVKIGGTSKCLDMIGSFSFILDHLHNRKGFCPVKKSTDGSSSLTLVNELILPGCKEAQVAFPLHKGKRHAFFCAVLRALMDYRQNVALLKHSFISVI